jgi:SAM-dependent methyltransferase
VTTSDPHSAQKEWLAGVFDRAAPTYDRVGDAYHDYFGARLVEAAGIGAGARILDVACGRGAVLVPAAASAGPMGRVVGVDISAEMIRAARDALGQADAGVTVELHVMDGEHLNFDAGAFDVVLCSFGVFFFPSPARAMSEFLRVLTPGGVAGLSAWTGEDERWGWEDDLLKDLDVSRRAISRPFDRVEDVEQLLTEAGFDDVRSQLAHRDIAFATEAQWWEWKWSYSIRGVLEQVDATSHEAFRAAAFAAMQPLREPAGFPMRLTACLVFGRKPG